MKGKRLAMTATFGLLGLVLGLLIWQPGAASGTDLMVCVAGPPDCQYDSIQAAVDAAGHRDVIKVATGTYTGVNDYGGLAQVVYVSKTVTIQGGYTTTNWTAPDPGANPTTLDAEGQGRVLYITGEISPTIEGLRITGGDAAGLGGVSFGWDLGGGVYVITATALIRDNQVFSNTCSTFTSLGGGMALMFSNATVSGNTFSSNTVGYGGGALHLAWHSPTIDGNSFHSNIALYGGGAWLTGSTATFSRNTVMSNTADIGGGVVSEGGAERLVNNVIAGNQVSMEGDGGGLWIHGSSPKLLHNTIARNSGGSGIYVDRIEFGGIIHSSVSLTNTILVDHAVGISVTGGNTVTVDSVLWYNAPITVAKSITAVVTVQNQYTGDPAFAADGYHLTAGSAAIDRGVDAGVTVDIDGQARPAGAGYDLGADEFWYRIYLPLVLRN